MDKVRPRFETEEEKTKSLEAIGKLSAKFGHDVNNILGAIKGCVDLIKQKLGPDCAIEKHLKIMDTAVSRGTELTDKLRGFVRPGEMRISRVHLKSAIESVVELLRKSGGPGFDIVLNLNSDAYALAHEFSLTQMLMGICMNSIEAMQGFPDRSLIIFLTENEVATNSTLKLSAGKYLRMSIVDHGKGIPTQHQEHLFEPFFSTKPDAVGKGMGLTLAMTDAIMKKLNGALSIMSIPDSGTVVHLYFPVAQPQ